MCTSINSIIRRNVCKILSIEYKNITDNQLTDNLLKNSLYLKLCTVADPDKYTEKIFNKLNTFGYEKEREFVCHLYESLIYKNKITGMYADDRIYGVSIINK